MTLNVLREVNTLRSMTVKGLREKYIEVFGEETRSCNKDFLWKRIAWRVQVLANGDLSERARQRAKELANDADIRIRPQSCTLISDAGSSSPRTTSYSFQSTCDQRIPMPGAILCRQYKGTTIRVMILEKGFEYNGEIYRSLTAITRVVTGSQWNGFHFFGLKKGKTNS